MHLASVHSQAIMQARQVGVAVRAGLTAWPEASRADGADGKGKAVQAGQAMPG